MTTPQKHPDSWRPVETTGFIAHIGPLLTTKDSNGNALFGLATNDTHSNHIGLIHGGVIASLLDQAIAITAWNAAGRQLTVTVQMDTRYLGAAKAGDLLEARASLRHSTRSLLFVDGEVACGDALIATATAVMKISRKPKDQE